MPQADEQAPLDLGLWGVSVAAPFEIEPDTGLRASLDAGVVASVVFSDEELYEGESLAAFVDAQCELVHQVLGECEQHIEALERSDLAGAERADRTLIKVRRRLRAEDGSELDIGQAYMRWGQRAAIVTCAVANATLEAVADPLNRLLATTTLRSDDGARTVPWPMAVFP